MSGIKRAGFTFPQLPPWLWLWVVIFLIKLPNLVIYYHGAVREFLCGRTNWEAYGSPLAPLLISPALLELLPLLALTLGIAVVFLPWLRARYIEWKYRLQDQAPEAPALVEIQDFLQRYAPDLQVKVNLLLDKEIAFVYPTGYRRAAVAICGGMVIMWRRNRASAEAILFHEIAHYRHGDSLIIGAGSFLEGTLRWWWGFALFLVLFPITLVWIDMSGRSIVEWYEIKSSLGQANIEPEALVIALPDAPAAFNIWTLIWHKTHQLFKLLLPGFVPILAGVLLRSAALLVVPLFGIWCAEFNADRFAMKAETTPCGLLGALTQHYRTATLREWILSRISPPPIFLRQWMAKEPDRFRALVLLLLLFPMSYGIRLVLLLASGLIIHMKQGFVIQGLAMKMAGWTDSFLREAAIVFLLMGAALAIWPLAASGWAKVRSGCWCYWNLRACSAYGIVATTLLAITLFSWPYTSYNTEIPILATSKTEYGTDEDIEIRFSGLPGNAQDWITVVERGAPAQDWGEWNYTDGKVEGKFIIRPRPPGNYEIRLFFDWPNGGFNIKARQTFTVGE